MSDKKETTINITSTAIEKGIDSAKVFLEKLIMPTVEESGMLIKDQISYWRFKNQIKMLNRAKKYCEKNQISTKQISLKLLCPMLEYSGIEEDGLLQDKWSILLSNMVDSEQNIENQVFPYILSQLSKNEFLATENYYNSKRKIFDELRDKVRQIEEDILSKKSKGEDISSLLLKLRYEPKNIREFNPFKDENCKEFEIVNIVRLGLLEKIFFSTDMNIIEGSSFIINHNNYISSEFGELFIKACQEKQQQ